MMKKLLIISILHISLIISSQANDIREFEIEGISIGESLLNYASEGEIKKFQTSQTSGSKKYKRYYNVKKDSIFSPRETVNFLF